jgi:hypothetical protein
MATFARGHKKVGGRQIGTPNRLTITVKDAIEQAAECIGGVDRLAEWVQEDPENERAFWVSIYPKLLPVQLAGDKYNPAHREITFTWKAPAPSPEPLSLKPEAH